MFGGVEAGGTKFVCVIGTGPGDVVETTRIEVTDPTETIASALGFFRRAIESGHQLDAIGIGSFGPVELRREQARYGWITTTPKQGWSDTDMVGPFAAAFDVPVAFDTDVNAAALAEGRWGAARGLTSYLYLTVGTGIGGGAIVDGQPLHGLVHPEMGHVAVPRRAGDRFEGLCPFHGDCLEGMASGSAIGARFGRPAQFLDGTEREAATQLAGFYLAAGIRSIIYAVAPERVVVGGGLSEMPGVLATARAELRDQLKGYPGLPEHGAEDFIVPAYLGGMAGPSGTLILAEQALSLFRRNSATAGAASGA